MVSKNIISCTTVVAFVAQMRYRWMKLTLRVSKTPDHIMNSTQQQALENLRAAAAQDQWMLCRENIIRLFPELNQSDVIKIVVNQAHRFLSDLSHIHPNDKDLVQLVEALRSATSLEMLDQQGRLIDPILQRYWDWPGVSNFRNGFKGISKPQQYFDHSGEFIDTAVSLVLTLLTAIGLNSNWGANPDDFSKTFFGPDIREAVFMLAHNRSAPQQVEFRESLWIAIANDIEMALQTQ